MIKTLLELKEKSTGNFKKVVEDLIQWYGAEKKICYGSSTKGDTTKIKLEINTTSKYSGEHPHIWKGKGFKYTALFYKRKTVVNGYGNSFVQSYFRAYPQ